MEFLVAALFVSQLISFIFIHILFKRQQEFLLQLIEFNSWRKRFREVLIIVLKEHKREIEVSKSNITAVSELAMDHSKELLRNEMAIAKLKSEVKKPVKKAKK